MIGKRVRFKEVDDDPDLNWLKGTVTGKEDRRFNPRWIVKLDYRPAGFHSDTALARTDELEVLD